MFCTSCGKQIPDENQFCTYCGAKLRPRSAVQQDGRTSQDGVNRGQQDARTNASRRPEREWTPPGQEPKPGWTPPGREQMSYGAGLEDKDFYAEPEPGRKKSILPKIAIALIALAVFFGAAFFGYRVFSGGGEDTVKEARADKDKKDKKKKDVGEEDKSVKEEESESGEAAAETAAIENASAETTAAAETTGADTSAGGNTKPTINKEESLAISRRFSTMENARLADMAWFTELRQNTDNPDKTIIGRSFRFDQIDPWIGSGGWKAMLIPVTELNTDTHVHTGNVFITLSGESEEDPLQAALSLTRGTSIDPATGKEEKESGTDMFIGEWTADTGHITADNQAGTMVIEAMFAENDTSRQYAFGDLQLEGTGDYMLIMVRDNNSRAGNETAGNETVGSGTSGS